MAAKQNGTPVQVSNPDKPRRGDLKSRASQVIGPFELYLETGATDPDTGKLKMEEYKQVDGTIKQRPEREKEPFLEDLYFKRNYLTPVMEDRMRELRLSDEYSEVLDIETDKLGPDGKKITEPKRITTRRLNASIVTLVSVVTAWDLNVDGEPVPITEDGIREAGLDADLIYAILGLHNEITRPPQG